jgi:hypothetical protein
MVTSRDVAPNHNAHCAPKAQPISTHGANHTKGRY